MAPTQVSYRTRQARGLAGPLLTVGDASLVVGPPPIFGRERTIPFEMIEGFCVERIPFRHSPSDPAHLFTIAFREGVKRRVNRWSVDADDRAFQELIAALGERRREADFTRLPVSEALARMRVPCHLREVLTGVAIAVGGIGLIVAVMVALWYCNP